MKNKRRALVVIVGVIAFAFVSVTGAILSLLGRGSQQPDPIVPDEPTDGVVAKYTGNSLTASKAITEKLTQGHVYLIEFGGQAGKSSGNVAGGYGAINFCFYKADSTASTLIGTIGAQPYVGNGGTGTGGNGAEGGAPTWVYTNFACPKNGISSATYAVAGAGGGAGGGSYCKGGNAGYKKGVDGGWGMLTGGGGAGGAQAFVVALGTGGAGGSGDCGGGGGGGGCGAGSGGGGGRVAGSRESVEIEGKGTGGGGGGGASSNNCYPLYGADSSLGISALGAAEYGCIYVYDMALSANQKPTGVTKTFDGTASSPNAPTKTPGLPAGPWQGTKDCISTRMQYSANSGSTWAESRTTISVTNVADSSTTKYKWRWQMKVEDKYVSGTTVSCDWVTLEEGTIPMTINKKNPTYNRNHLTFNDSTYDGTTHKLFKDDDDSITGGGQIYYAVTYISRTDWDTYYALSSGTTTAYTAFMTAPSSTTIGSKALPTDSRAGKYRLWVRAEASANYNAMGWQSYGGNNADINRATRTLSKGTTAANGTLTYNGSPQQLFTGAAAFSAGSGTIYYDWSFYSNGGAGTTNSNIAEVKRTDSGEEQNYYLWAKAPQTNEYEAVNWTYLGVSQKILRANSTLTNGTLAAKAASDYSGSSKTLFTGTASATGSSGSKYYTCNASKPSESTDGSIGLPTGTNAGSYKLWMRLDGNSNYKGVGWTDTGLTATINKADGGMNWHNIISDGTKTYPNSGGTLFKKSGTGIGWISVKGDGTVYYTTTSTTTAPAATVTGTTSIPTGTSAGNYYLWMRVAESTNYKAVGWTALNNSNKTQVKTTINKATPTITGTMTATTGIGYGGNKAMFSGSKSTSVAGTMYYSVKSGSEYIKQGTGIPTSSGLGSGSWGCYYKFVPTDTSNYYSVGWNLGCTTSIGYSGTADSGGAVSVGEIYNSPSNVQKLFNYLGGGNNISYNSIKKAAAKGMTANDIRASTFTGTATQKAKTGSQDIEVTFGGKVWHVVYLSTTGANGTGDPILTLWLKDSIGNYQYNTYTQTTLNGNVTYPAKMYSVSYIRYAGLNATTWGATGQGTWKYWSNNSTSDANPGTLNSSHPLADFTLSTAKDSKTDVIVKPNEVAWQKNETGKVSTWTYSNGSSWGGFDCVNDSLQSGVGTYFTQDAIIAAKARHADWGNDYIWLPSMAEVGGGIDDACRTDIWQTSAHQRASTYPYWKRSGAIGNTTDGKYNYAYIMNGEVASDGSYDYSIPALVTSSFGVRPALHINLNRSALRNSSIPVNLRTETYDGNSYKIEDMSTKPDWYRGDMTFNYYKTKNATTGALSGDVTEVKNAGTYYVKITKTGTSTVIVSGPTIVVNKGTYTSLGAPSITSSLTWCGTNVQYVTAFPTMPAGMAFSYYISADQKDAGKNRSEYASLVGAKTNTATDSWYSRASDSSMTLGGNKTYYVYYYAIDNGTANYNTTTVKRTSFTVSTLGKDPKDEESSTEKIKLGSLAVSDKNTLTYNGSSQQLFTGAAQMPTTQLGGTIKYKLTTTDDAPEDNTNESTDVTKLTGQDAKTYYLWARFVSENTNNRRSVGWQAVLKSDGKNLTRSIDQLKSGSLTLSGISAAATREYDATTKAAFSGTLTANNSDSSGDGDTILKQLGTITYYRVYRLASNGTEVAYTTESTGYDKLSSITALNAGSYKVKVAWAGNTNVEGGSTTLSVVHTVSKLSQKNASKISLSGLNLADSPRLNASGKTNLVVAKSSTDNGCNLVVTVTTDKTSKTQNILTSGGNIANNIQYRYSTSNSGSFTKLNALTDLASATVGLVDTYTIYFKFTKHNNIADNVEVAYPTTVTTQRMAANDLVINGLSKNNGVTFDGLWHSIYNGSLTPTKSQSFIGSFNDVYYAISTSNTTKPDGTDEDSDGKDAKGKAATWFKSVSSCQARNYGNYYLWVKWGQGAMVEEGYRCVNPSSAYSVGQLSSFTGFSFSGITKNSRDSGKQFDNTGRLYTIATDNNLVVKLSSVTLNIANDLGTITYGLEYVSNLNNNSGGNAPDSFGDLATLKTRVNVGNYYLWIHWSGTSNCVSGSKVYQTSKAYAMQITQADNTRFYVTGITTYAPTYNKGSALTMFDVAPVTWIRDKDAATTANSDVAEANRLLVNGVYYYKYDVLQYKYCVTKPGTSTYTVPTLANQYTTLTLNGSVSLTKTEVNWNESVDKSVSDTATNTGLLPYVLWLQCIGDSNVAALGGNQTKSYTATMYRAKSFVGTNGVPLQNTTTDETKLYFTGGNLELLTIRSDNQFIPPVQYGIANDKGVIEWTANGNYTAIKRRDVGTYTVYWRGGCDTNYYTDVRTNIGTDLYDSGKFTISKREMKIVSAPSPKAGLIFNGDEQVLFTGGTAMGYFNGVAVNSKDNMEYSFDQKTWYRTEAANQQLKKKPAGTYTIYYRGRGEETINGKLEMEGHYPSDIRYITVTIDTLGTTKSKNEVYLSGLTLTRTQQFINDDVPFATGGITSATYGSSSGKSVKDDLGNFTFAVNQDPDNAPDLGEFGDLASAKKKYVAANYYLWVHWSGVTNENGLMNIEANTVLYSNQALAITKAELNKINIWGFSVIEDVIYNAKEQPMFTGSPVLEVDGREYDTTLAYEYAVLKNGTTPTTTGIYWKSRLVEATAKDVYWIGELSQKEFETLDSTNNYKNIGDYVLWVRLVGTDANIKTPVTATYGNNKMHRRQAFVVGTPKALNLKMVAGSQMNLIQGAQQRLTTDPKVEYCVYHLDTDKKKVYDVGWTESVDAVKADHIDTYTVCYRGKADTQHYLQDPYLTITALITRAQGRIKSSPGATNPVYTGVNQPVFTPGVSTVTEQYNGGYREVDGQLVYTYTDPAVYVNNYFNTHSDASRTDEDDMRRALATVPWKNQTDTALWLKNVTDNTTLYYYEPGNADTGAGIDYYWLTVSIRQYTATDDLFFDGIVKRSLTEYDTQPHSYAANGIRDSHFTASLPVESGADTVYHDVRADLGDVTFAVTGNPYIKPDPTKDFGPIYDANINNIKAKGITRGKYYLWVKWTGTANANGMKNIAPGWRLYYKVSDVTDDWNNYKSEEESEDAQYSFKIRKTQADHIFIDPTSFVPIPNREYDGTNQQLFSLASGLSKPKVYLQLAVGATQYPYDAAADLFRYSTSVRNGGSEPSDWDKNIANARQKVVNWVGGTSNPNINDRLHADYDADIGYYYLWVWFMGDSNLDLEAANSLNRSTYVWSENVSHTTCNKIKRAESYASVAPTPLNPIFTGVDLPLIKASTQNLPPVEYRLGETGEWRMLDDINLIAATNVATGDNAYTVYYRGGPTTNYKTQYQESNLAAQWIKAELLPNQARVSVAPSAINNGHTSVIYNGDLQPVFYLGTGAGYEHGEIVYRNDIMEYTFEVSEGEPVNWRKWDEDVLNNNKALMKQDVHDVNGNEYYTLYYRAGAMYDQEERLCSTASEYSSITVTIERSYINPIAPTAYSDIKPMYYTALQQSMIYPGRNLSYSLFATPAVGTYNNTLEDAGVVEFGISSSPNTYPSYFSDNNMTGIVAGLQNYSYVKAKLKGEYYLWYRIWAGKNHFGASTDGVPFTAIYPYGDGGTLIDNSTNLPYSYYSSLTPQWICCTSVFNPATIEKAPANTVKFFIEDDEAHSSNFSWAELRGEPSLPYTGTYQPLFTGELIQNINGVVIPNESEIYYAVTNSNVTPSSEASGWLSSLADLAQLDIDDYYLHILVSATDNVEEITRCYNPTQAASIIQAIADNQEFIGIDITEEEKVYNGMIQILADGILQVQVISNIDKSRNIVPSGDAYFVYIPAYKYFEKEVERNEIFFEPSYDDFVALIDNGLQSGPINAKIYNIMDYDPDDHHLDDVIYAGKYRLWVYVEESKNLKYAIKCLNPVDIDNPSNSAPLIEIKKAENADVTIVKAELSEDIEFNTSPYCLLQSGSSLVINETNEAPQDFIGEQYYYITNSESTKPQANVAAGWTSFAENSYRTDRRYQKIDANTYYIWVKFDNGRNYKNLEPVLCGTVTIRKAIAEHIINHDTIAACDDLFYLGEPQKLTQTGSILSQYIINADGEEVELTSGFNHITNTGKISYGVTYGTEMVNGQISPLCDLEGDPIEPTDWKPQLNAEDLEDSITGEARGTYVIWVKVEPGHDVEPYTRWLVLVEIQQATANMVQLSNVVHTPRIYDGTSQSLADFGHETIPVLEGDEIVQHETHNVIQRINGNINNNVVYSGQITWGITNKSGTDSGLVQDWYYDIKDAKAIEYGNYYVWVHIAESNNIAEQYYCFGAVLIDTATIDDSMITKPQLASGLTYANWKLPLITEPGYCTFTQYNDAANMVYSINPGIEAIKDSDEVFTRSLWTVDYEEVVAENAGSYPIWCAILSSPVGNWKGYVFKMPDPVVIAQATPVYSVLPTAVEDLIYNDEMRTLVDWGELITDAADIDKGNCEIVYSYDDEHYYSQVEFMNMGKTNVGTYRIYYKAVLRAYKMKYDADGNCVFDLDQFGNKQPEDTYSNNYKSETAAHGYFDATISKRNISWYELPSGISGIKQSGYPQELVYAGRLSSYGKDEVYYLDSDTTHENPISRRIYIEYTDDFNDADSWSENIPTGEHVGMHCVWYRVVFDSNNNTFFDLKEPEYNDSINVLITKLNLAVRVVPEGLTVNYAAVDNVLISAGDLTYVNVKPSLKPWIEYGFEEIDGNGQPVISWLGAVGADKVTYTHDQILAGNLPDEAYPLRGVDPKRTHIGTYKLHYQVRYDQDNFIFNGNDSGSFVAEIVKATINDDRIVAIIKDGKITLDDNRLTNPYLYASGAYAQEFIDEFKDHVIFEWRLYEQVNARTMHITDWATWQWEGLPEGIGHYQIRARFDDLENIYPYTQSETYAPYQNFDVTFKDGLVVNIHFVGETVPVVSAWLDLTGDTDWKDAPVSQRYRGLANKVTFANINTTGKDGNGVIKIYCESNNKFYFLSLDQINDSNRALVNLTDTNTSGLVSTLNRGFKNKNGVTDLYVYEVYRISYHANGGLTANLPDQGWKWYDVPYTLADNRLEKADRIANGWNTTAGGLGTPYRDGAHYTKNVSQTFYAQFIYSSAMTHVVRWQIGTYELSASGIWFDTSLPENATRTRGVEVLDGARILLPEIDTDEFSSFRVYGKYLLGWKFDGAYDYYFGIKADRDFVFTAVLQTLTVDPANPDVTPEAPYVDYVFRNNQGEELNRVRVADGAASYMALSGLTESDFRHYDYDNWVEEYKNKNIDVDDSTDNVIAYTFGVNVNPTNPDNDAEQPTVVVNKDQSGEWQIMFLIIACGVGAAVVALLIYGYLRKYRFKM